MEPTRNDERPDALAPDFRATRAADDAVVKSAAHSKRATSKVFLVLRIALFVLACVFAVAGVMGFMSASNTQSRSRLVTTESINAAPARHACVIVSYDDSDASVDRERAGVLGIFGPSGIRSDVFYLDARAGANATSAERMASQIVEKAQLTGSYDVVVAAGDEALSFVSARRELFAGIPVAFFAVADEALAKSVHDAGIATGFLEAGASSLSLKVATDLVPSASRAVVLVDGSNEAASMLAQLGAIPDITSKLHGDTWDVSRMSRDELEKRLSALGPESVVLLLAANRDNQGAVYSPSETAYFVTKSTSAPVFSALGGVGEGVCGALFIDREVEGADAAKLAIDLMNGGSVAGREIVTVEPACSVFDAAVLTAHGIDLDATPENSTIINEPAFSWRVIRPMIRPILCLLAAILCIAGFGVIGFRRSVQSNQAIIASRNDLQYRLYHDLLTELPNRHALDKLAADSPEEGLVSMMQVDIIGFTDINDTYGHAFGNEVIKTVAERLSKIPSLLLVRSGGDEFTLAFDHALTPGCAEIQLLYSLLDKPVVIGDDKVDIAVTTGIANREPGMSGEDLVVFSDLATHHAKQNSEHAPIFYSATMRHEMEHRLEVTAYLKQAIADESIRVLWQPQVNIADMSVHGYEALCRLEGDKYYPGDFIPVAEMSGLVNPLDRIVTKKVIEQMGQWAAAGRRVGVASINFSAAQLRDKGYCDFLAEQMERNNVPGDKVKVEITESMLIENEAVAEQLFSRLRSMGITLALDDFGTGYSSLYRMANSSIGYVKLDKSLVDTFMVPGKEGFIADITRLVHGLNKKIIVEGVETYEQYRICHDLGCDIVQGYFFARPMTAEEAIDFNPSAKLAIEKASAGDKTRNTDWHKYARDERGRWIKKPKEE